MFKFILLVALLGAAHAQRRNPNPCADVAAGVTNLFRNDWADCRAYFWCEGPQARPTELCREGFQFDEGGQVCREGSDCDECPEEGNLAVSFNF